MIDPITDLCDFCHHPAHLGACAELLAYVERVKDRMFARLCPTCGAIMKPAGKRAWICPNQADQGNGIPRTLRAAIQADATQRVTIDGVAVPF